MEKETLEQAVRQYANNSNNWSGVSRNDCYDSFLAGAKWQAERMYSEAEVLELLNKREDYINSEDNIFDYQTTKEWLEQFKK